MDVIQYKCPNCGGDLQFDPATGAYACQYCRSKFSQSDIDKQTEEKTQQAGSDSSPASADINDSADQTDSAAEDARVYSCPSCGAQIMTDATTAATFCYYCHNPVVLSGRLEGAYKPDYVAPFKIDRKQALQIFEDWVAKKKYVPSAFYSKDQIEKFSGVYFPYMLYTCNIAGRISAQATKTTVEVRNGIEYTDRGVYQVDRDGNMEVKDVMRIALKKANGALAEGVLPFETEEIKPFNMSYLSGFMAEKRDMDKSDFEEEVTQEVRDYAVEQLRQSVAGYEDIRITSDNTRLLNEKWKYVLMPVWTLTYKAGEKIYYFSVNGQTGKTLGELPVDEGKLRKRFLMIFIPVALVLLAIFYFLF